MDALITLSDSCVYVPALRAPIDQVMSEISSEGVHLRLTEAEYRNNGFQQTPLEQEYGLEQMIYKVCAPILQRANKDGTKIAAILFGSVTNSGNQAQSLFAGLLREFSREATPILQLEEYGCATIHLSLHLTKFFFAKMAKDDEAVLFVTADKARNAHERSDTYMLFGDAASAALYRKPVPKGQQVLTTGLKVDGIAYDQAPERIKMYFSTFYLSVRQLVQQVLRESNTAISVISLIFCTNLGLSTWSILAKVLNCSIELFYTETLGEVGHLHNTDILLSIKDAVRSGKLRKGDLYLTITVGFGGYYGCSLHRYE